MKKICTFLFFSCFALVSIANDTIKTNTISKKIILDNRPLGDDEKFNDFNRQRIKSFTNRNFNLEDLEKNRWLFYTLDIEDIEASLMPRLFYKLIEDPQAIRSVGYGNVIAFEVTDKFDVQWLESSMKNIEINFAISSKTDFIDNYNK